MSTLARAVMMLAAESLAADRPDWARAMAAEFEEAADEGRPFAFALGCLVATWRTRLHLPSGRFAAARSLFAVIVILPFAAFHLGCAFVGVRFLLGAPNAYYQALLLGDAEARATAAIYHQLTAMLIPPVLLLGTAHLVFAWNLIEGRPRRMLAAAGVATLAAATMAVAILLMMPHPSGIALQFAAVGIETAALTGFLIWRARLAARLLSGDMSC